MALGAAKIRKSLDAIAAIEPKMKKALVRVGYPAPRPRPTGYGTLLRTIIGQQVSIKAAAAIWAKLEGAVGTIDKPESLLKLGEEALRAAGLSRQKVSYCRSLAELVVSGELDFAALPKEDEAAIALLSEVKGIGRWSAEIYLLFAEGRPDIWPAGDLAVQIEMGRIFGLDAKPTEKQVRQMAEKWRPHRGAAAIFLWHHYNTPVI